MADDKRAGVEPAPDFDKTASEEPTPAADDASDEAPKGRGRGQAAKHESGDDVDPTGRPVGKQTEPA